MIDDKRFEQLKKHKEATLILFLAPGCPKCTTMEAILKVVTQKLDNPLRIKRLDLKKFPSIASAYKICELPTSMLFKDNKLQWIKVGIIPATTIIQGLRNLY